MIVKLARYPVKSMLGEDLHLARLTVTGMIGDRRWAVTDSESGRIASAKHPRKWSRLLYLAARACPNGDAVTIAFPDGQVMAGDESGINEKLSTYLGWPVHLSSTPPSGGAIERVDPIVRGTFVDESERHVSESMVGGLERSTFVDYGPLHLLTLSTLNHLRQLVPCSAVDVARFRPNLVIDLEGTQPFAENDWKGKRLSLGTQAVLELDEPTPRCAIPALAQPGIPDDPDVIRIIARHNRVILPGTGPVACLGVYARVLESGLVKVGDPVELHG